MGYASWSIKGIQRRKNSSSFLVWGKEMIFGVEKVEHRQKTDDEKIVDILGYFWSLKEEDQKQILEILNASKEKDD